jgi:hypothetical protein
MFKQALRSQTVATALFNKLHNEPYFVELAKKIEKVLPAKDGMWLAHKGFYPRAGLAEEVFGNPRYKRSIAKTLKLPMKELNRIVAGTYKKYPKLYRMLKHLPDIGV